MTTRHATTTPDRIRELLSRTVEEGVTVDDEREAVRKAWGLAMAHGLDLAEFALPPRYRAVDGLVVPVDRAVTGRRTIKALCDSLLLAGASMESILSAVRTEFPDAATTPGCVSWYKSKLMKAGKLARGALGGTKYGTGATTEPAGEAARTSGDYAEDGTPSAGEGAAAA